MSSTQGRVGLRLGFSENFRFRLGLGFCRTGLGWVSVFLFQKTRFSVGFWVFSKFKKKMEIFRQNCDERRKKFKKTIQIFKLTKPWFRQKSLMVNPYITKSFGYWMLVLGRIRPTYGKLVLSLSTTDFRLVLGPAFGSRTILCCVRNHGRTLAPAIMNIFNGRPWFDHVALYMLQRKFE